MNSSLQLSYHLPARPTLPRPERRRWQPLRIGLVDLFHYDSEEFWFRDGHLLLRGNNGTGKSKVLSLTLPFLLDAQLKSSRIEPDGDPTKKMGWNLLLGVHERRTGYAWIEFGRCDGEGVEHYLTLGAGLAAAAARQHVDSWYFIIEDSPEPFRIGESVWLVSDQRVVLSKERLRERLQGRGLVFENARSYRRGVDERLFRLGQQRYDALIDTLIQLRQPQLSKKPDERLLSNALSEALPPLSPELLIDVADAMGQLEEDRHALERYQKLRQAIVRFDQRYRTYTGLQSRRQARLVRQAQTEFDSASQERNEAARDLAEIQAMETAAAAALETADGALSDATARYETLRDDPAMQDANRLDNAKRDAEVRERTRGGAVAALQEASRRIARDESETRRLTEEARRTEQALSEARVAAVRTAVSAGVSALCGAAFAAASGATLAEGPLSDIDATAQSLRQALAERRAHIAAVRRRLDDMARANAERRRRLDLRDERQEEMVTAEQRRANADAAVAREGAALVEAWNGYLDTLTHITVPPSERESLLEAVGTWVATLSGVNPALSALQSAQQAAAARFAARTAELRAEQSVVERERDALESEHRQLVDGADIAPPAPPTRAANARTARTGAPLWQLIDFREPTSPAIRAGLEAALEGTGLLDAWIDPDGRIERSDGTPLLDTRVVARPLGRETLGAFLVPTVPDGCVVEPEHIARLLDGIVCSPEDAGHAETWIAPDGRFRLGALAGDWAKSDARYIGFAAREAARQRRIAEIDGRLVELAASLGRIETGLTLIANHQSEAEKEWRHQPICDALRKTHAEAATAAQDVARIRERLLEAEQLFLVADAAAQLARHHLQADADDLGLPSSVDALDCVAAAVESCRDSFEQLVHTARDLHRASGDVIRQRQREEETRNDLAGRQAEMVEARRAADESAARLEVLMRSVGAKVDEIRRQLENARQKREACEAAAKQATRNLADVGKRLAVAVAQANTAEEIFAQRGLSRKMAVDTFQRFVSTGMLAAAWSEAPIPDVEAPWTIDPALNLARRTEQALLHLNDDDATWTRVQRDVTGEFTELQRELSGLGEQAQMENTDWGMVVHVLYQNRPERPDRLIVRLAEEVEARTALLTAKERDILENHLQAEIAAEIQRLLQAADAQRQRINTELHQRPTSTGVRYRLLWKPLSEAEGAPVGFEAARKRLLATNAELWTAQDRDVIGQLLRAESSPSVSGPTPKAPRAASPTCSPGRSTIVAGIASASNASRTGTGAS